MHASVKSDVIVVSSTVYSIALKPVFSLGEFGRRANGLFPLLVSLLLTCKLCRQRKLVVPCGKPALRSLCTAPSSGRIRDAQVVHIPRYVFWMS